MIIRMISGAGYLLVTAGFFLLREFVDVRLFNILIWFFGELGTFEVARAVKKRIGKPAFVISVISGVLFVPLFSIVEWFFTGFGFVAVLALCLLTFIVLAFVVQKDCLFYHAVVCVYPSLPLLTMLVINYMPKHISFIALALIFIITPMADTFAYCVGRLIGGKKLCPKLSPKKTWAGAVGGTIGGIVASLIVFYAFGQALAEQIRWCVVLFVIIGIVTSILTIFGDLFASYIKRRVGIKDYGKIMPGHGGIMDRIDGTCFASMFIMIAFLLIG